MISISAKTIVRIWGTKNAWSLAPYSESAGSGLLCDITIDIEGVERDGYHLVMSPSGFFTADTWYETKQEALKDAEALFGIGQKDWTELE